MSDYKVGDYFYSLEERIAITSNYRNVGTVHKIIKIVDDRCYYYIPIDKNLTVNTVDMESFRKATDLEIITAKLLGTCYE